VQRSQCTRTTTDASPLVQAEGGRSPARRRRQLPAQTAFQGWQGQMLRAVYSEQQEQEQGQGQEHHQQQRHRRTLRQLFVRPWSVVASGKARLATPTNPVQRHERGSSFIRAAAGAAAATLRIRLIIHMACRLSSRTGLFFQFSYCKSLDRLPLLKDACREFKYPGAHSRSPLRDHQQTVGLTSRYHLRDVRAMCGTKVAQNGNPCPRVQSSS
jgi:hypothetical protein